MCPVFETIAMCLQLLSLKSLLLFAVLVGTHRLHTDLICRRRRRHLSLLPKTVMLATPGWLSLRPTSLPVLQKRNGLPCPPSRPGKAFFLENSVLAVRMPRTKTTSCTTAWPIAIELIEQAVQVYNDMQTVWKRTNLGSIKLRVNVMSCGIHNMQEGCFSTTGDWSCFYKIWVQRDVGALYRVGC